MPGTHSKFKRGSFAYPSQFATRLASDALRNSRPGVSALRGVTRILTMPVSLAAGDSTGNTTSLSGGLVFEGLKGTTLKRDCWSTNGRGANGAIRTAP
jgi:hypothetical protein